jgi:hypothetical protein
MTANETRIVSTREELNELDWEVPGIEFEEEDRHDQDAIDGVIAAFEYFNKVELVGQALRVFNDAVEDYYIQ